MTLSEKILSLRTARGLSQGDLAEKLGVSRQSVSKWETGQSTPDLDKIIKLADLFGVTVDELVREEEAPKPESEVPSQDRKQREFALAWLEDRENQKTGSVLCIGCAMFVAMVGLPGRKILACAALLMAAEVYLPRKYRLLILYLTALMGAVVAFGMTGAVVMLIVLILLLFIMGHI